MDSRKRVDFIVRTAIVAALYAVLTFALAPISYGMIQFRLSEVMTLLAFINPVYIVGLTLGTLIANMASQLGMMDMVFGTLATFLSVFLVSKSKNIWIASLWPSVVNGVIIGTMLYKLGFVPEGVGLLVSIGFVFLGEFVVVTVIGVPLYKQLILKQDRLVRMLRGEKL
jgi:uncharacterized membrane protein